MASDEDVNTPALAIIGLLGAILLFALIVLLTIVFYHVQARQRYEKDVSEPYAEVSRLVADQQGRLADYGWVDGQKQIAHIPIQRAKELVTEELSEDPHANVIGAGSVKGDSPVSRSDRNPRAEPVDRKTGQSPGSPSRTSPPSRGAKGERR
jgi:hypothetical protein